MSIIKGLLIVSFVYNLLLSIVYFSKSRLNNIDNKIYSIMLVVNLIGVILEFLCITFAGNMTLTGDKIKESLLVTLTARLYLVYLLCWISAFITYICSISYHNNKSIKLLFDKHKKKIISFSILIFLFFVLLLSVIPMYFYNDGVSAYTWGPAINMLIVIFTISVLFGIVNMLISYKSVRFKKYSPVFMFFASIAITILSKGIDPSIQLVGTLLTFTTILMYFTIENPDLKLLNELSENRKLIEDNLESNSSLIFNLSQEIKKPINDIKETYSLYKNSRKVVELKNALDIINDNASSLSFITSNFLDLSTINSGNLKITSNSYNLRLIINSISLKVKNNIKNGVEYHFNVDANVPNTLYGDEVKVKQILNTILLNSAKYTDKGFIDLNVSAINKYDVSRLLITIEDSGKGMSISKVNSLMETNLEFTEDDKEKLNESNLNIDLVNKITKVIGGHILIKSEVGKGSKFTLILEQKISDHEIINERKFDNLLSDKRVLIICEDKKLLNKIKSIFDKKQIDNVVSLYGNDGIEKIKSGEKFDLIILENEMKLLSGYSTKMELDKIGVNVPYAIISRDYSDKLVKAFKNDGFKYIIDMQNLNEDINNIIENNF